MSLAKYKPFFVALLVALLLLMLTPLFSGAQEESRYFPETKHYIKGRFLNYWTGHGGLPQQGYPLSEEFNELSEVDGKIYTVQYFERAVFEYHPENPAPNDILLSLLGMMLYKQKYPDGAPNQVPNTQPGSVLFPESGKRLGGAFLTYWQKNGGLAQQGYPISEEFLEKSELDGKTYKVQYFERAVFEDHPENPAPHNVLLSQLGTFRFKSKHGDGEKLPKAPTPTATPLASPTPLPILQSGGLGLSKRAFEQIYGPVELIAYRSFIYSNGRYDVHYTTDGLVWAINDKLEGGYNGQGPKLSDARQISTQFFPKDAKLINQKEWSAAAIDEGYGDQIFYVDTYHSPALGRTLRPGTIDPREPTFLIDPDDMWAGAEPGTFYVQYGSWNTPQVLVYTYNLQIGAFVPKPILP